VNAGGLKLQGSSDTGATWTDLDEVSTGYDNQSPNNIIGTFKHNAALGSLKFRLYYNSSGNSVTFGSGSDAKLGRKLVATGPINSPSFGGGWGKSGMLGLSADQTTGLSVGSPVLFDTATGDFTVSGGSVVIKGGSKAQLEAGLSVSHQSGDYAEFRWYDVTNAQWTGKVAQTIATRLNSSVGSQATAMATVTPASDTTYQLRISALSANISIINSSYTWAKISATLPTGGAWAKSSVLTLAGTQSTGLTAGSPIQFANITGDHLLSNYGVTVKGGSVAMLRANVRMIVTSSSDYVVFQWYNVTTSAYEGDPALLATSTYAANNQSFATTIINRAAPSVDTVYQLRIFSISGGPITTISTAGTNATVESTDPNPPMGGSWAKSSQVTLTATQLNLAANDAVNFAAITGDHALNGNRILIKAGSVAVLAGELSLDGATAPNSTTNFQWWNYTTSQWVGTASAQFAVTWNTDTRYANNTAYARVSPSVDTEYQLRAKTVVNQVNVRYETGCAMVYSTDPNPPKGGNWALSSLVTLSANQTSNLAVGQPIRFDAISGDHTLQNYRVKINGGQKAELIANVLCNFSGTSGYINTQWYNVTAGTLVGKQGSCVGVTVTGNYGAFAPAVTLETPIVDSEYELRVTAASQITNIDAAFSSAQVHSTLPNASVTSQVIRKETLSAATTAWTVTLPVSCKAIRVKLYLVNASSSPNGLTLAVNGTSTGYYQNNYSDNGAAWVPGKASGTPLNSITASQYKEADLQITVGSETIYREISSYKVSDTNFGEAILSGRISQSADISSLTFTGNQTNGIGAGSYIIVERVDADLSQDLGWQDYTPTCYIDLTSATTVPNITPSVRYRVDGKTLFMQGTLNFTGAPTGATDLSISLPTGVNVVSLVASSKFPYCGSMSATNNISANYNGRIRLPLSTENANRVSFRPQTSVGGNTALTTTSPFTWANGAQLEFDFFTEIQ
jgi:hypothetical protein